MTEDDKMKEFKEEAIKGESAIAGTSVKHLHLLGDKLVTLHGYKDHEGIDAVRFFLMERHHWTPAQVKSMSLDDLMFAILDAVPV